MNENRKPADRLVVGITGTRGAEEELVAIYLARRGFKLFKGNGADAHDDYLAARCDHENRYAMVEIEAPVEVEVIRTLTERDGVDFLLVGVDADMDVRHIRWSRSDGPTVLMSLTEFANYERRNTGFTDPCRWDSTACTQMADVIFDNSGTVDELYRELDGFFKLVPEEGN